MPNTQDIYELLPPSAVAQILQQHGVIPASRSVHIEQVPRNAGRFDESDRARFRVFISNKPHSLIIASRGPDELAERSRAFAEACPALACRFLADFEQNGIRFHALEYIEGHDLEWLVTNGKLTPDQAAQLADAAVAELESTRRPSGVQEAAAELDLVFAKVLTAPMFGAFDKKFLRDVVLPYVRAGALAGPFETRWTNGDFIARNIIVDQAGKPRLIDYEFATRTHFPHDDGWRWRIFSRIPIVPERLAVQKNWSEAFSILRHLALAHGTNASSTAIADAGPIIERLLRLVGEGQGGFRSSIFYQRMLATPSPGAQRSATSVQLYWSTDGNFAEDRSMQENYPCATEAFVTFTLSHVAGTLHLRLDPCNALGVVHVTQIKISAGRGDSVRVLASDTRLLNLSTPEDWKRVRPGPGLYVCRHQPHLTSVALTEDAFFYLPPLSLPRDVSEVVCHIRLRFDPTLQALPSLVTPTL